MVEVELSRIVIRERSEQQCIYLKEKGGERQFPIVIGIVEASAIDRRVRDIHTARPMTHDLLAALLIESKVKVDRVVICDLRNNTFYARIELTNSSGEVALVDARPSDAIATAVQTSAPIFVEESVLDSVIT